MPARSTTGTGPMKYGISAGSRAGFDAAGGDSVGDERRESALIADNDRLTEGGESAGNAGIVPREDRGGRVAGVHRIARLHRDHEPDRRVDGVLDRHPAAAELEDRPPDPPRLDGGDHTAAGGPKDLDRSRLR